MYLSSNNWKDIQRYYEGCFTKFRETGDQIFSIRRVSPTLIEGRAADGTPLNCFLHHEEDQEPYLLDYILPKKSFFEYNGRACLLSRIPARQYKRGLCPDNTQISALLSDGTFEKLPIEFPVLEAYIQKQNFRSFKDVNAASSVAVSPRMAVSLCGYVFVDGIRIAAYDSFAKTITTKHKLFMTEIQEVLQRTGEEIKIVIK